MSIRVRTVLFCFLILNKNAKKRAISWWRDFSPKSDFSQKYMVKGFFGHSYEKCAIHRWKKKFWLNLKISQKYRVEDIYCLFKTEKSPNMLVEFKNIWVNSKSSRRYMVRRIFEQNRNLVGNIWWGYKTFGCKKEKHCSGKDIFLKTSPKLKKTSNT